MQPSNQIYAGPGLKIFNWPGVNKLTTIAETVSNNDVYIIKWYDTSLHQQPDAPVPSFSGQNILISTTGLYSISLILCLQGASGGIMKYASNINLQAVDGRTGAGYISTVSGDTAGLSGGITISGQNVVIWLSAGDTLETIFETALASDGVNILEASGSHQSMFQVSRIY